MTEITATIRFKDYVFSRVKPTNNGVAYTPTTWVGKTVNIIPVPYTISEKIIQKEHQKEDGTYEISIPVTQIIIKKIGTGKNVGYAYLPNTWIGLDVLIIETPQYNELY